MNSLGIAELLLNACLKFFAEVFNCALQRLYRTWRIRAEGFARSKETTQLLKCLDIPRLAFAAL